MAGAGGVRATLPDMVRYLEGELGTRESQITPALARTQQETMGMNWIIQRAKNDHTRREGHLRRRIRWC
jgi:serine-type D-Ala-D-Ala carboxypeptidase/endopeptidase